MGGGAGGLESGLELSNYYLTQKEEKKRKIESSFRSGGVLKRSKGKKLREATIVTGGLAAMKGLGGGKASLLAIRRTGEKLYRGVFSAYLEERPHDPYNERVQAVGWKRKERAR